MPSPAHRRLFSQFLVAERSVQRRSNLVASRFELAGSVMILLQLVCHSAAALDDLGTLAEERNLTVRSFGLTGRLWLGALLDWLGELWPRSPRAIYASIAAASLRETEVATTLRKLARQEDDQNLAEWCALWLEQRTRLAGRLIASLAPDEVMSAEAQPMFVRSPAP